MKSLRAVFSCLGVMILLSACGGGGGGHGSGNDVFMPSSLSNLTSSSSSRTFSSLSSNNLSSPNLSSIVSSRSTSSSSATSVQITLQATTDSNGKLDVSWSRTAAPNLLFSSCEFHMNVDEYLPRVPFKTLANCGSTGSFSINDFPFFGGNLSMITNYSDGAINHQLITNIVVLQSPTNYADPVIAAIDWSQVVVKTNPKLVQNRDALLRVHVTASAAVIVPDLQLTLNLSGATRTVSMTKPVSLPTSRQFRSLNFSYSTIIDKAWMKSGLTISLNLNGQVRTVTPVFGDGTVLYLTLVPTTVLGKTSQVVDSAQVVSDVKTFWPLADVQVRTRAGFDSRVQDINHLDELLNELRDLHTLDQDPSHYYGFFSGNLTNAPFGGLGDKPGVDAIGLDYDNIDLMPHELGHNFDLGHVDCGSPDDIDPNYPYPSGSIGSVGINLFLSSLRLPDRYVDVMSYCTPKHSSDYSYENAQDFLIRHPPQGFKTLAAAPPPGEVQARSLFISGLIAADDTVQLRRFIPVNSAAIENPASDYQLRIVDASGNSRGYFVVLPQVDHPIANHGQYFSVIIPYTEVISLQLVHSGRVIYSETRAVASPAPTTAAPVAPHVQETSTQACLSWDASDGTSATLIHLGDQNTTMVMDNASGNVCVQTQAIPAKGNWQIILRKGIMLREFSQLR